MDHVDCFSVDPINPTGLFIHPFAQVTNNAEATPQMPTNNPVVNVPTVEAFLLHIKKVRAGLLQGKSRSFQENGMPIMGPACFMK